MNTIALSFPSSEIKALYRWDKRFFLSYDDAEKYFDSLGEEGYNGTPELTSVFEVDQIPESGCAWVDAWGVYPDRGSAKDFDSAELKSVKIVVPL